MNISLFRAFERLRSFGITTLVILFGAAFLASFANAATTIRVNSGGGYYVDSHGQAWVADSGYNSGAVTSVATTVAGTTDPALFKTDRFSSVVTPQLQYTFAVPNGTYKVNLYFAETWTGGMKVGGRVFNVAVQGTSVFSKLDIYAAAGANHALVKSANATVTNGSLSITFSRVTQNPKVNAIEVIPSTPVVSAPSSVLLASYYGNQGFNMQQVRDMEAWQGKKHAAVLLFSSFCSTEMSNLFAIQLPAIWNNKNIPLITWEPYTCTPSSTPTDIESQIANGQYDSYIGTWADQMKKWIAGPDGVLGSSDDRRVYIRLAHEMNGNWYPWSGNPSAFIAMWRRVHQAFDARGLGPSYIQWAWVPNVGDSGSYKLEQYYPGDAYVDWVGTDGYNCYVQWIWKTPTERFSGIMTRLQTLTAKPVMIGEYGALSTTATGISVSAKNLWATQFFTYVASQPSIHMVAAFNRDSDALHDWAFFGGGKGDGTFVASGITYKTFSAYKTSVQKSNVIGSTSTNLRLLTDSQFQGK